MPSHHDAHDAHDAPVHGGHPHPHTHTHDAGLAPLLALDAIVHQDYLTTVTTWLQSLTADTTVQRVLDVGPGPGAGTIALAQRFPAATLVAADVSADMLERTRALAEASGLGDRVATELADIAADVTRLGTFDVAWASASLHEVGDPDRAFANLRAVLRPGGLLAVVEMDSPPRTLPLELADFEDRLHAAVAGADHGNAYHPDWTGPLARAGFTLECRRTFTIDEPADGHGPVGEYATLNLARIAQAAMARLDDADQALVTTLLGDGPDGLRRRTDLRLRGARTAWIARRP